MILHNYKEFWATNLYFKSATPLSLGRIKIDKLSTTAATNIVLFAAAIIIFALRKVDSHLGHFISLLCNTTFKGSLPLFLESPYCKNPTQDVKIVGDPYHKPALLGECITPSNTRFFAPSRCAASIGVIPSPQVLACPHVNP